MHFFLRTFMQIGARMQSKTLLKFQKPEFSWIKYPQTELVWFRLRKDRSLK